MDEHLKRKYERVLEILPDIADCAHGRLILVGGTALAVFYLKHRISIDIDLVPLEGSDVKLKEELKGCLTKRGYRTSVSAYTNQFVVHFEDTSIKIEIFQPEVKIKHTEARQIEKATILIASLDDLLDMKNIAYKERKAPRDLFDIFCITKFKKEDTMVVKKLISKYGPPEDLNEIIDMALDEEDIVEFKKAIS